MAKQSLTVIKNWFKSRLKPTQAQYWDTWDSFWHKDSKIPIDSIENLESELSNKASTEYVDELLQNTQSDQYEYWTIANEDSGFVREGNILYNHYAVTDILGIAPEGCKIPSKEDFKILSDFLGGNALAGPKLKEYGLDHWLAPNMSTNSSGFTALGIGVRHSEFNPNEIARFVNYKMVAQFWNSDILLYPPGGLISGLSYNSDEFITWDGDSTVYLQRNFGLHVRCLLNGNVDPGTITDYDGNVYDTVKIGDQIWLKQNLCVKHFKDGTLIPEVQDGVEWLSTTDPALCYFENNPISIPLENINVTSHSRVIFKNSSTVEFSVNNIGDSQIEIEAHANGSGGGNLEIPDNSISYTKCGMEFKGDLTVIGNSVDWSSGMYAEITLNANTTFTFSNLEKGKTIVLRITGAYVLTLPASCILINGGTYSGAKWNSIILTCVNAVTPKVLIAINTEQ